MYGNVQNVVWLPWQPFKSRTLISWGLFVTTTRRNTELLVHNHIYALFGLSEIKESTYNQEIILYVLKCEEYCVTWIRLRIDLSNITHPDQIYIPTTCNQ